MKIRNILYLTSTISLLSFNTYSSSPNTLLDDEQVSKTVQILKNDEVRKRKVASDIEPAIEVNDGSYVFSSKKSKSSPSKKNHHNDLTLIDGANRKETECYLTQLDITDAWYPRQYIFQNHKLNEYFKNFLKDSSFQPATILLGNVLYKQYLTTKDIYSLTTAALSYHAPALLELSVTLADRDYAARAINLASAQGYAPALYSLSQAFDNSPELYNLPNIDPKFAHLLCEEAAKLGNLQAQWSLASALLTGSLGQKISPLEGFQKLDELSSNGNSYAKNAVESINSNTDEIFYEAYGFEKPSYEWKYLQFKTKNEKQ